MAVENTLTREALQQEKERLQMLLEVNTTLLTNRDLQKLFSAISDFMHRMIRHDYASVAFTTKLRILCLCIRWIHH